MTVYLATSGLEASATPFHERGWTSFEYQLAWLAKLSDRFNCWPQVIDLGLDDDGQHDGSAADGTPRGAVRRPPPAAPGAFEPGGTHGDKRFFNGSDRSLVAAKFRECVEEVLGGATVLDYSSLGWADDEMDALGLVLPLCTTLERLDLDRNPITRLPASIGRLPGLKVLVLERCTALTALDESAMAALIGFGLRRLSLVGCTALAELPQCVLASLAEADAAKGASMGAAKDAKDAGKGLASPRVAEALAVGAHLREARPRHAPLRVHRPDHLKVRDNAGDV